jgi:hypothetical protein
MCDFPLPYDNIDLVRNWFDFDDGAVNPIRPGKLRTQFGGRKENAYMLLYREKGSIEQTNLDIPAYWMECKENSLISRHG